MKFLSAILTLFVLAFSFKGEERQTAPAPPVITDTFGCWGYGNVDVPGLLELYTGYDVKGIHITFQAGQIRPTLAGAFNWAILDTLIERAVDSGYWIGLQGQFGPDVTPQLLDGAHGVDTFYTTRGFGAEGPYPDYYDPQYKQYYFATLDSIINHIAAYTSAVRNKILYYHVSEGSTGDTGPYKGEPYNVADTIGPIRWTRDFRYPAWDSIARFIAESAHPTLRMLLNTGNDGLDLMPATERFPLCWVKEGTLSHDVEFEGEQNYYDRITPPSRGEVQGYIIGGGASASTHKVREGFCLIASALDGDLKMMDLPQGWMNNVKQAGETKTDQRLIEFFNKYSNNTEKCGFLVPADRPSFDDTLRFPTATFGTIAKAGDSTDKLAVRLYHLKDSSYSDEFREFRRIRVTSKYLQDARVQAIRALFPQLGFVKDNVIDPAGNDNNTYLDDFNVGGVNYYSQKMSLVDQYANITGVARIGDDTCMLGRWAAMGTMLVDIDNSLRSYHDNDSVRISISYYDSIPGTIDISTPSVLLFGCNDVPAKQITVGSSRKWLTSTFIIPRFKYRQNTWDLKVASGFRYVGLIQFENLYK